MANPSILMLSNLLKDLQENPHQPYLMGALRGAKGTFGFDEDLRSNVGPQVEGSTFTGPEVEGSTFVGPEMEGSTIPSGNDPQLTNLAPPPDESMSPPPGIAGASSPSVPPGGAGPSTTQNSGGDEGGFWHSSQAKDIGSLLASSLGGALGGAIGGNWRAGAAAGGMDAVKDIQAKQQDALKRMHGAWEAAYNDAMALPVEVHTTPGLEPVAQAQQALIKDLQDGKVDNEKNLSNWFKAKAMYGGEIENLTTNKKIAEQKQMADAQFTNEMARKDQQAEQQYAIANDQTIPENAPEKQRAIAFIYEYEQAKNAQDSRMEEQKTQQAHYRTMQLQNAASLGMQQKQLNMQGRRLDQQANLSQMGMEIRIDENNRRAFAQQFAQATKMAASAGMGDPATAQQDAAMQMREPIIQLSGLGEVKGGNAIIQGKPVPLINIIGKDLNSGNWDSDGTPSQTKGWPILLAFLANSITTAPVSRDLSLTGAFGNQSE